MTTGLRAAIVSTLAVVAGVIASASPADAQVLVYGIAGPAGYSGFFGRSSPLALHAAGGGEVLAAGRVGAAGEFGLLASAGGALWVSSASGAFHIVPSVRTSARTAVSPFVIGGYTRMSSGEGAFDAWNVGGGADVWLTPGVGLRLEFRDHVRPDRRGDVHYWAIRAGVVLR